MARSDTGIASWTMLLWVPQTVDPFLGGLASRCRMRSRISSSESEDMVIEIHYLNLNLTHAVPTSKDGLKIKDCNFPVKVIHRHKNAAASHYKHVLITNLHQTFEQSESCHVFLNMHMPF
jgi:hypothetical protein